MPLGRIRLLVILLSFVYNSVGSSSFSSNLHSSLSSIQASSVDPIKSDSEPQTELSDNDAQDEDAQDSEVQYSDASPSSPSSSNSDDALSFLKSALHASLSPTSPPLLHFGRLITPHLSSPTSQTLYNLHTQKLTDYYGTLAQTEIESLPATSRTGSPYSPSTTSSTCNSIKLKYFKEIKSALSAAKVNPEWSEEALEEYEADVAVIIERKMSEVEGSYSLKTSEEEEISSSIDPTPSTLKQKTLNWLNKQLSKKLWYKRFLNQVIALGLNYVQGTLALRAVRREAERRDREIPKWPI
ncbi:hypothetical protein TrLO_g179 [Triparma laevis f. longispina]|uniref:Uncharacterized protein n=1 Tax=Triparma laevis f. longispina TaxID=1714387 RepID=A0A9W6ZLY9_9STRA|nr:hypothetical protein TrLO_g179 [Triparma laevis f. longispina]